MFKHAKKIITVCLSATALLLCFAACKTTQGNDTDNAESTNVNPTGISITGDYKVIYESGSDKSASKVRKAVYDACGKTPDAIVADEANEEYDFQILIGNTGKSASTDYIATLGENEYGVKVIEEDGKLTIVIAGQNSDVVGYAAELFVSEYLSGEKGNAALLKKEATVLKAEISDDVSSFTFGGIEFEEEIIKVTDVSGIPYTRMTKLQDGRLMMVYGQNNQIVATYSSDNGLTWSDKVNVTSNIDQDDKDGKKLYLANAVPYQLADGTILVAYRANEAVNRKNGDDSVKVTGKYHSSIRIMGSSDNGKTFERHSIVWDLYEENIQKWYASFGLWEPHLGMLNGELACFFAIGKSVYNYDHIINSTEIYVYRNNTWVRAEYTSDETPGAIKNGMPVWQELSEGGYILAVESTQNQKTTYANVLTAKLLTSVDGKHWVNQCDVYIPKKSKRKSGAPYVVQLPNGQIVVSYMTDDELSSKSEEDKGCIFKFSISKPGVSAYDLKGESDFEGPFNVFNIPTGFTAIYGGMYVDDTYLYMYCATNYNGNKIVLRRAPLSQLEEVN
ncbi:MAG: sialidase family protein [Clostridia bacterium]|nr:sialidase family protein [Clostridia bacterium]